MHPAHLSKRPKLVSRNTPRSHRSNRTYTSPEARRRGSSTRQAPSRTPRPRDVSSKAECLDLFNSPPNDVNGVHGKAVMFHPGRVGTRQLQQKLERSLTERSGLSRQLLDEQNQVNKLKSQMELLAAKVKTLQGNAALQEQQQDDEISNLAGQFAENLRKQQEQTKRTETKLKSKLADMQRQLNRAREQPTLKARQVDSHSLGFSLHQLQERLIRTTQQLTECQSRLDSSAAMAREKDSRIASLQHDLAQARQLATDAQAAQSRSENSENSLRAQLTVLRERTAQQQTMLKDANTSLTAELDTLRRNKLELLQEVKAARSTQSKLAESARAAQERQRVLEQQLQAAHLKLTKVKKEKRKLARTTSRKVLREREDATARMAELQHRVSVAEQRARAHEETISNMKAKNVRKDTVLLKLRQDLTTARHENEMLQSEAKEGAEQLAKLAGEVHRLQDRSRRLERDLKKSRKAVASSTRKLRKHPLATAQHKLEIRILQEQQTKADNTIRRLRGQLAASQQEDLEKNMLISSMDDELQEYKKQIQALEKHQQAAEREIAHLQAEVQERTENPEVHSLLSRLQRNLDSLVDVPASPAQTVQTARPAQQTAASSPSRSQPPKLSTKQRQEASHPLQAPTGRNLSASTSDPRPVPHGPGAGAKASEASRARPSERRRRAVRPVTLRRYRRRATLHTPPENDNDEQVARPPNDNNSTLHQVKVTAHQEEDVQPTPPAMSVTSSVAQTDILSPPASVIRHQMPATHSLALPPNNSVGSAGGYTSRARVRTSTSRPAMGSTTSSVAHRDPELEAIVGTSVGDSERKRRMEADAQLCEALMDAPGLPFGFAALPFLSHRRVSAHGTPQRS